MAYYNAGSDREVNNSNDELDENSVSDELSLVPLDGNDFTMCKACGSVGIQGQFYTRNRQFCSLRCARRYRTCTWRFKYMGGTDHMAGLIPVEPLPELEPWHTSYQQPGPPKKNPVLMATSYQWKDELFGCDFLAAPVNLFKHAPLHEVCTFEGMKVEVKNTETDKDSEKNNDYFWVATVLKIKGYMALLRYEGCGSDDSKDFWVNLCCTEVHPVGWCATQGKPIIPPQSITDKYADWKKFLVRQLTGARTLPTYFYEKLHDSQISRFSAGCIMEVVDKDRISQVKVATVNDIVGKRLHVKYYDSPSDLSGFWCHEDSPLIHPVGWAFEIGHPLDAPQTYMQRVAARRLIPDDTVEEMFYKYPSNEPPLFSVGQKIEAIDPLNLSAVCAATVMRILNEGYMMIRIDFYPAEESEESGADWFCYHQRSPSIFPVGFAQTNNIPLIPPAGYTADRFSWERYLRDTGTSAAPRSAFAARGHVVSHGFVAGMRLECADLMDPRLVCVATVARVVADLLNVHFDGWGTEYDQWLWAHSTDMYPVGWCRAVGHRLEGPQKPVPRVPVKRTAKPTAKSSRRRRKQAKVNRPSSTTEESSQNSDMGDNKAIFPSTSTFTTFTDVKPKVEIKMDVDLANHLNVKQEYVKTEHVDTNTDLNSGNENGKICKLEMDLNSTLYAPNEGLADSGHGANLIVPTEPKLEYIQEEQEAEMETPSNEDDSMDSKVIPRLVNTAVPLDVLNTVEPENWTTADVAKFLTVNDWQTYCVNFSHITGAMLMQLTKDEIIELLEMKVGPSLKIFDLITQLKGKLNPGRILSYK